MYTFQEYALSGGSYNEYEAFQPLNFDDRDITSAAVETWTPALSIQI